MMFFFFQSFSGYGVNDFAHNTRHYGYTSKFRINHFRPYAAFIIRHFFSFFFLTLFFFFYYSPSFGVSMFTDQYYCTKVLTGYECKRGRTNDRFGLSFDSVLLIFLFRSAPLVVGIFIYYYLYRICTRTIVVFVLLTLFRRIRRYIIVIVIIVIAVNIIVTATIVGSAIHNRPPLNSNIPRANIIIIYHIARLYKSINNTCI